MTLNEKKSYIIKSFSKYWLKNQSYIARLPVIQKNEVFTNPPTETEMIILKLPEWADSFSALGGILIPRFYCNKTTVISWRQVDWFGAMYWYLHGVSERQHEKQHGPIHSYSHKLKSWDKRIWQYAWANRIALFLRAWAVSDSDQDEDDLFGEITEAKITLTHDVDAVSKTLPIRLKQSVFHLFNAFKQLLCFQFRSAFAKFSQALKFIFSQDEYWCFDEITKLEAKYDLRSTFHFYAKDSNKFSFKRWLFDPSYDVKDKNLRRQILELIKSGWTVGLHQSYDAWQDSKKMYQQKAYLEQSSGVDVRMCRQHWLRFSWEKTWRAQEHAGLKLDATLMFNDRPGFRNGAAITYHPYEEIDKKELSLSVIPTVLMDSHFFDYDNLTDDERISSVKHWLNEILFVQGDAAVVWHQRVYDESYGWYGLYEVVLKFLRGRN